MAVPVSEFESTNKQLNLSMQKCNDLVSRNARLAKYVSDLQKQVRENMEAEENLKHANDHALELEEEIEIVRKRLEYFDPVFRWESEIFQKIATVL